MTAKKIVSVLLLLAMLLSLVACVTGGDNTTTTSESTTTTTSGNDTDKDNTPGEDEKLEDLGMPIIKIRTENKVPVVSKENYVDCTVSTLDCAEEYKFSDVEAGIRLRGNSSIPNDPVNEQAPYRIKFEKKRSMFGLNDGAECKSWVLLKPDMGNPISFELGKSIFLEEGYYCSDYMFVEVYLNGKYRGVYVLCEQSQINKNRVDVSEAEEGFDSYKTGYLLEIDNYGYQEPDTHKFWADFSDVPLADIEGNRLSKKLISEGNNINGRWYVLKNDYVSREQLNFIHRYIESVFYMSYQAIEKGRYKEFDKNFNIVNSSATSSKEAIEKYIDIDSVVNMYIIQEISMNSDVGAGSFYMSVDFSEGSKRERLTFECPWDFSWAYRATSRDIGENYEGLSACTFCPDSFYYENGSHKDRSNPWLILFMKADWFRDMVRERWTELKEAGTFERTLKEIQRWEEDYAEPFEAHYEKWGFNLPYEADRNYRWLKNRLTWLENKLFTMDN